MSSHVSDDAAVHLLMRQVSRRPYYLFTLVRHLFPTAAVRFLHLM